MVVKDFLEKLVLDEDDVVCIGNIASYSRSELYSLSKDDSIFDKEISEIRLEVYDGWGDDGHGNKVLIGFTKNIYIEVDEE